MMSIPRSYIADATRPQDDYDLLNAHAIEVQRIIERIEVVEGYLFGESKSLGEAAHDIRRRLIRLVHRVNKELPSSGGR